MKLVPLYFLSQEGLRAMSKIGAYLRVFYTDEGMLWEKRNMDFFDSIQGKPRKKDDFLGDALIYIVQIIICILLSVYKTVVEYESFVLLHQPTGLYQALILKAQHKAEARVVIILIVMVISITIVKRKKTYVYDERKFYYNYWDNLRDEEIKEKPDQRPITNTEIEKPIE